MKFRRNARLNTGQVSDRRGMRSAGRLGSPIAIGGGGGLIGLIVLVIVLVAGGGDLSSLGVSDPGTIPGGAVVTSTALAADCQTGQDANERQDCRIVAVVNSVQEFWDQEFRDRGGTYPFAQTVLFTGATVTACGTGSAQTGPFYCPTDSQIYIDLSFFDDLRTRFGARGGPFAESYVIAHEYGHHVQDVLGILRASEGGSGVNSDSVAVELQADCLAGVWAHHAVDTSFIETLTEADIADGLDAAAAVGDDRIQQQAQGRISPESWTHGSSAQRQQWFQAGYRSGDMDACDTFNVR